MAWTDYDSVSENLDFGIQDNSKQDQNSSQSQSEDKPSENDETDSNKENNENESASSVDTSAQFKKTSAKKPRTMSNHFQKLKLQRTLAIMANTNLKNRRFHKSDMTCAHHIILWAIWFLFPFILFSQNQETRIESIFLSSFYYPK